MFSAITSSPPASGVKARRRRKTCKEERVCPVCRQAFKKAEHLSRHLRSHTKEKPFACHVCDKKFARQDTLLRHSRCHVPDNDGYMPLYSQYAPVYEVNGSDLEGDLRFEPCQAGSSALTRHTMPPYLPPNSIGVVDPLLFPELKMPGINDIGNYLEQIGGSQLGKLAMSSLFRVIGLLQRISHWRIAQNLASTLLALVEETPGLF